MESVELHNQSQPLSDDEAIARLAECYRQIIEIVGEDSTREGLLRTPVRAAKALWYATGGYRRRSKRLWATPCLSVSSGRW